VTIDHSLTLILGFVTDPHVPMAQSAPALSMIPPINSPLSSSYNSFRNSYPPDNKSLLKGLVPLCTEVDTF
jgi:hypothetical protein